MFPKIKALFFNLVVYGIGDVATSLVGFLLLPVYVRYFNPTDYGAIALLLTVEVFTKVVYRWGIDASFMRLYFDCPDQRSRQTLASTIFWFLVLVNGALLAAALVATPTVAPHLFGRAGFEVPLAIVLINTFIGGFYFIPFHVLRIQGRSAHFVALTFVQQAVTILARLALVIVAGLGVLGVTLADLVVSIGFTLVLARWFAPLIRPMFSRRLLAEALRFGLPRVPHGAAHQAIAVSDRYILSMFVGLREIGLYSIGATFGLALKLFLSAFENAWAPFYFATMKERDAKQTFSLITTYGLAVLVWLTAGLAAVAPEVVSLMTTPDFAGAARVVPWIGVGVMLQGVYLLTSIGLNITKHTEYYPIATGLAAATSVVSNLLLIPRFGFIGAAWSTAIAYGVLAGTSLVFSQRFYPIRYELPRIIRLALAGVAVGMAARALLPTISSPVLGMLARGAIVVLGYPALLFALGFFDARELGLLARVASRLRMGPRGEPHVASAELAGELAGSSLTEFSATEQTTAAEPPQSAGSHPSAATVDAGPGPVDRADRRSIGQRVT